jgi:outer membrane cobalamin receptor
LAGLIFCAGAGLWAQEKSLDELLDLNTSDLLALKVVSVLKNPESIGKVPATVRVITAEDIRDNGYFTLEDALADLPGLQFRNIEGFNSYVFMRGAPGQNNKVLLLVDGIQINELNSGGFYAGGQFNLANVERIEVVYGPASALYGTNAVSGIISIFTRSPRDSPGGRVSVQAGNLGARMADARYAHYSKAKDVGFSVSAMYKQNGKADLKGEAGDFNWTDSLDNFENDAAMDARVQYKSLSAGVIAQDKDSSYATAQVSTPQHVAGIVLERGGQIRGQFRAATLHTRNTNQFRGHGRGPGDIHIVRHNPACAASGNGESRFNAARAANSP